MKIRDAVKASTIIMQHSTPLILWYTIKHILFPVKIGAHVKEIKHDWAISTETEGTVYTASTWQEYILTRKEISKKVKGNTEILCLTSTMMAQPTSHLQQMAPCIQDAAAIPYRLSSFLRN
jgi:hypothetical protein